MVCAFSNGVMEGNLCIKLYASLTLIEFDFRTSNRISKTHITQSISNKKPGTIVGRQKRFSNGLTIRQNSSDC